MIDWDTSRELELPGIDLLNMSIQRHRRFASIPVALTQVASNLLRSSPEFATSFAKFAPKLERGLRRYFLGTCLVRYTSRSLEYPHIAAREAEDLLHLLNWWRESSVLRDK